MGVMVYGVSQFRFLSRLIGNNFLRGGGVSNVNFLFCRVFWIALIFYPLLAVSAEGEKKLFVDDWEAKNCPGAMPADPPPYDRRVKYYAESGDEEKYEEMVAKQKRYSECRVAVAGGATIPMGYYKSHEMYMKAGATEAANRMSLSSLMDQIKDTYDPRGVIYPILEKEYKEGYSKKMADMAEVDAEKAGRFLMKKYFCKCLAVPLGDFDF
ncbi:hypothetical protein [Modicisalibacter coralii]|uniref:hypothetical protein n=1 Tax=Modicisalibacter coralii TaxID=2304602 RepID=UPI00100BCF2E|nr:hypothetical protein [Halomonas coralii]